MDEAGRGAYAKKASGAMSLAQIQTSVSTARKLSSLAALEIPGGRPRIAKQANGLNGRPVWVAGFAQTRRTHNVGCRPASNVMVSMMTMMAKLMRTSFRKMWHQGKWCRRPTSKGPSKTLSNEAYSMFGILRTSMADESRTGKRGIISWQYSLF